MNIVITYCHKGNDEYPVLIKDAFKSAERFGYNTVSVGNYALGKQHIDLAYDREPLLMNWILAAQKSYIDSPLFNCNSVLFSPDAIINKPLEPVFSKSFDMAFTNRNHSKYPINNGVIFIKPGKNSGISGFWGDCLAICKNYSIDIQEWFGDQKSLWDAYQNEVYLKYGLDVSMLPCDKYNASPSAHVFDGSMINDAFVIHLKGKRKHLMAQYMGAVCR